jgi:hypothetical protein
MCVFLVTKVQQVTRIFIHNFWPTLKYKKSSSLILSQKNAIYVSLVNINYT